MARSFSGFAPQNECVKEEWRALEASQEEITRYLELLTVSKPLNEEDQDVIRGFLSIPE